MIIVNYRTLHFNISTSTFSSLDRLKIIIKYFSIPFFNIVDARYRHLIQYRNSTNELRGEVRLARARVTEISIGRRG